MRPRQKQAKKTRCGSGGKRRFVGLTFEYHLLHIRYVLPLLFGPFPKARVVGCSALELIDLAVHFFEALRLLNLVQTRQLVNIKSNVFQGDRSSKQDRTNDEYDYASIREWCQPQ